ncbi:hypothetical protein [Namhaeicola litoreus]|uniref:Outer membrane protein beta-barrel domain-containing protein n=1 Tax=Namhaeicola litoreus TaxID=1052145 RepID=A0ABW3Y420_9FLAO
MKKKDIFSILLIALPLYFTSAQEPVKHPILTSRFQFGAGVYIPTQKVKFSVDGKSKDQLIEFDETFDFNNNRATPQFTFDWRFANKWRLGAEYFNASYATKAVLKSDITAGDYTFNKGSNVGVGYTINLYRIFVGHLISSGQKHELGGGLGVHLLSIKPFIEGNIIVNEGDNTFKRVAGEATAPLPNIALWYYFAPTEKWAFTAKFDWFGITVNEYSGSLWDLSPGVRYRFTKYFGLAIDYRYFLVNAGINQNQWNGSVDLSFSGPSFTLYGSF